MLLFIVSYLSKLENKAHKIIFFLRLRKVLHNVRLLQYLYAS